jgi:predicted nucleic acid-binding protein
VKVLVDTSVWSLALRRARRPRTAVVEELEALIDEGRVAIVGPIRQELLSGVRDEVVFARLRDHLGAFPDEPLDTSDFERAAEHFNACRGRGIQGSNTDFLLCAVAERHGWPILTTDNDFRRFSTAIPIVLHSPRSA